MYVGATVRHPRSDDWIIVCAYEGTTLTFRYEDDRLNVLYTIVL
jgi:hypothetical protein